MNEGLAEAQNRQSTIGNRQCLWCPRRDSNPEPTDYESAALTVELQGLAIVVGKGVILAEMCAGAKSDIRSNDLFSVYLLRL